MWLWQMKLWGLGPGRVRWKGGLHSPLVLLRLVSGCRAPLVTVTALVNHWTQLFEKRGVPEARESSEYIVAHVLGAKTFQSLPVSRRFASITDLQREQIAKLCTRRLQRMPVQYVIGEWDFQGLTLKMESPVFIPRPETEELVNLVLHEESQQLHSGPLILDLCCGSGAIALSLLSKLTQSRVVAVDKGEEAVKLTRENAQRLHLENRIQIVRHDITSGVNREQLLPWGPVDFVVSNPPYIFHCDMEQLAPEILSYEDTDSLDGGEDGMRVIKEILSQAPKLLKDSGSIFLEVDPRHPELVENWLQSQPDLDLSISATHVDFCGNQSILKLKKDICESKNGHHGGARIKVHSASYSEAPVSTYSQVKRYWQEGYPEFAKPPGYGSNQKIYLSGTLITHQEARWFSQDWGPRLQEHSMVEE